MNCIWILATPRSGSTYLSELLNCSAKLTTPFAEHLSYKSGYRGDLEALALNPPQHCKVLHVQLNRITGHAGAALSDPLFDPCQTKAPSRDTRERLERKNNFCYIRIRRNFLDSLCSYYMSAVANAEIGRSVFTLSNSEDQKKFQHSRIKRDKKLAQRLSCVVRNYYSIWDEFVDGIYVYEVKYESLLINPSYELSRLLEGLRLEQKAHAQIGAKLASEKSLLCSQSHPMYEETRAWISELAGEHP